MKSSEFVKVRVIDDLAEIGDERAIPHLNRNDRLVEIFEYD